MKLKSLVLLLASTMVGIAHAHTASARSGRCLAHQGRGGSAASSSPNQSLCGRIFWLQAPRDAQGQLKRDRRNPDPALRSANCAG